MRCKEAQDQKTNSQVTRGDTSDLVCLCPVLHLVQAVPCRPLNKSACASRRPMAGSPVISSKTSSIKLLLGILPADRGDVGQTLRDLYLGANRPNSSRAPFALIAPGLPPGWGDQDLWQAWPRAQADDLLKSGEGACGLRPLVVLSQVANGKTPWPRLPRPKG